MRDGRVLVLVAVSAVCLAASIVYVARGGVRDQPVTNSGPSHSLAATSVVSANTIVFRNLNRKQESEYGFTAVAALAKLGERAVNPLACGRVYFSAGRGLCLEPAGAIVKQRVLILGRRLQPVGSVTLQGVPSRARVSPDGRYGAVTFFVYGHSYATPGAFSTQTTIIDLVRGKAVVDVERFRVTKNDRHFDSPDFNFWGVTFAKNSDRFYATLASRGRTYLVEGSVSGRTARVLGEDVECPSLSPDETRIAFKKRIGDTARWRLHTLDLGTMHHTALAETRSVDDQAEWLDDKTVLYGRDEAVWAVPADGSGTPRRLLGFADSPAVVRAA